MLIDCSIQMCPYRSPLGFCKKDVVGIRFDGRCSFLYHLDGSPRALEELQNDVDEETSLREPADLV